MESEKGIPDPEAGSSNVGVPTFEGTFKELMEETAESLSKRLSGDLDAISSYAAERATHLSTLIGQPGYAQAVLAERDNIALRAGINASRSGDIADQRIVGIIQGALRFGALAIANANA